MNEIPLARLPTINLTNRMMRILKIHMTHSRPTHLPEIHQKDNPRLLIRPRPQASLQRIIHQSSRNNVNQFKVVNSHQTRIRPPINNLRHPMTNRGRLPKARHIAINRGQNPTNNHQQHTTRRHRRANTSCRRRDTGSSRTRVLSVNAGKPFLRDSPSYAITFCQCLPRNHSGPTSPTSKADEKPNSVPNHRKSRAQSSRSTTHHTNTTTIRSITTFHNRRQTAYKRNPTRP